MAILECPKCSHGFDFATLLQQFHKSNPGLDFLVKFQEYLDKNNSENIPNIKVEPNDSLEIKDFKVEPVDPLAMETPVSPPVQNLVHSVFSDILEPQNQLLNIRMGQKVPKMGQKVPKIKRKKKEDPLKEFNNGEKYLKIAPRPVPKIIETPFPCDDCGEIFENKTQLREHRKKIHPKPRFRAYICSVCGGNFGRDYLALFRHEEEVHQKQRKYFCEFCDKKFMTASNKTRHEIEEHTEFYRHHGSKFCCYICGAIYKNQKSYEKHISKPCKPQCPGTKKQSSKKRKQEEIEMDPIGIDHYDHNEKPLIIDIKKEV